MCLSFSLRIITVLMTLFSASNSLSCCRWLLRRTFLRFLKQVLGTFIDGLVLFGGLAIFAVSDLIDNAVKIGHYVEQIEDDFGLRQFF